MNEENVKNPGPVEPIIHNDNQCNQTESEPSISESSLSHPISDNEIGQQILVPEEHENKNSYISEEIFSQNDSEINAIIHNHHDNKKMEFEDTNTQKITEIIVDGKEDDNKSSISDTECISAVPEENHDLISDTQCISAVPEENHDKTSDTVSVNVEGNCYDSDDNNEDVAFIKRKKTVAKIDDSDSEVESVNEISENAMDFETSSKDVDGEVMGLKPRKIFKLIDSDDEEEENDVARIDDGNLKVTVTEVESVNEISENTKNFETGSKDVDSEVLGINKPKKMFKLIDSDSEEEENDDWKTNNEQGEGGTNNEVTIIKKNKRERATKKAEDKKPKNLTPREALEQRKEIQSESQRMARESRVSLPYHKPKQRSFKEFQRERPKFAVSIDAITENSSPSVAIKMCTKQLEIISKQIEKREKEVESFFQSDDEKLETEETENETNFETDAETDCSKIIHVVTEDIEDICKELPVQENTSNDKQLTEDIKEICKDFPLEENTSNDKQLTKDIEEISKKLPLQENASNDKQLTEDTEEICKELPLQENASNDDPLTNDDCTKNCEDATNFCEVSPIQSEILVDELPEIQSETDEEQKNLNDCEQTEAESDKMECEEETPQTIETNETKPKSKLGLFKSLFEVGTPKLSGGPNLLIDLDQGVTRPDEVNQLMQRYIQHTSKRKHHTHKVDLNIVSVTGEGEIQKDKITLNLDDSDSDLQAATTIETPGEKLQKLRNNLQKQIAQQRVLVWQQKLKLDSGTSDVNGESAKTVSEDDDDEEEFCENDDDESSDDDDAKLSDNDDTKLSDNDDTKLSDKENEGLVADDDDEDEDEDGCIEGDAGDVDAVDDGVNSADDEGNSNTDARPQKEEKKIYSKIIEMSDDSDEELESLIPVVNDALDSTDTWDEDDCPPPGQMKNVLTTPKRAVIKSKPELDLLTPVCHLTALQSLNSGSKFLQKSPTSPHVLSCEPSPLKGWQKKLFSDSECTSSKIDDECTEEAAPQIETTTDVPKDPIEVDAVPPSTQDLINICSGTFTGMTQLKELPTEATPVFATPQDSFKSTVEHLTLRGTAATADVLNEEEDKLISQILDEDELREFKKKFMSPIITPSQAMIANASLAHKITFDSDEEGEDENEEEEEDVIRSKKMKRNAIVDSDDESTKIDDNDKGNEQHDDDDNDSDIDDYTKNTEVEYEYDSEENEVEVAKLEEPKKKLKASDFFENEAELSESEWGSEDEDEKNMDEMEDELGDKEQFDQNKIRRHLEKIHMREILDSDSREVKILQELLLEDGELHGAGRKRQFRWQNIDNTYSNDANNPTENDNENILLEDDENNEQEWRKKRFERELFLQKQQGKSVDISEVEDNVALIDSQIIKLGHQSIIKQSNLPSLTEKKVVDIEKQDMFFPSNKRGSFLSRTDQVLKRVAEYTKFQSTNQAGGTKQTKNFIFQTVSIENTSTEQQKKRKAVQNGTPQAIKKLRVDSLSPAVQRKFAFNAKSKKLFKS